jgi:hypothetical protein
MRYSISCAVNFYNAGVVNQGPGTYVMIFKNIFAEKFSKKIGAFDSKQS